MPNDFQLGPPPGFYGGGLFGPAGISLGDVLISAVLGQAGMVLSVTLGALGFTGAFVSSAGGGGSPQQERTSPFVRSWSA